MPDMARLFEEILVEQCAPTLAGLKPASMFRYHPEFMHAEETDRVRMKLAELRPFLRERGLGAVILKTCPETGALLILVYREERIARILEDAACRQLFHEHGEHPERGLGCLIGELSEKICLGGTFPHEIGLLLGYPPEDVAGFIQHSGKNCRELCYWKSYSDPAGAERTAAMYRKCTAVYKKCFAAGTPLRQLVVAA